MQFAKNILNIKYLILYLLFFNSGCFFNIETGFDCSSESISDSKKNNFFLQEYSFPLENIFLQDSQKISIKEIWVEKTWYYTTFGKKISNSKYNFIITFNNNFDFIHKNEQCANYIFMIDKISAYYNPVPNIVNYVDFKSLNQNNFAKIMSKDSLSIAIFKKKNCQDYTQIKEFIVYKKK